MTYAFRLRFHVADRSQLNINQEEWHVPIADDAVDVRLYRAEPNKPISQSRKVALIGRGFASQDAAQTAALEWRNCLLVAMARARIGIDVGGRLPTSVFLPAGLNFFGALLGVEGPVRDDVHGISVFEEVDPWPKFASMNVAGQFGILAERASQVLSVAYEKRPNLLGSELVAFDFFNMSYFQDRAETRLVSLVIAVEALSGNPRKRPQEIRSHIAKLVRQTRRDPNIAKQERVALAKQLATLGSESISKTCRRIVQERLGKRKYGERTARDFFMTAYDFRSRIVHGGNIPSENEVRDMLGDLERFVSDMLTLPLVGEENAPPAQ